MRQNNNRHARMDEVALDFKTHGFKADSIREMKRGKKRGEPVFRHGNMSIDMDDDDRIVFQFGKVKFKFTEDEINRRIERTDEKAVMERMKEKVKSRPEIWGRKHFEQPHRAEK